MLCSVYCLLLQDAAPEYLIYIIFSTKKVSPTDLSLAHERELVTRVRKEVEVHRECGLWQSMEDVLLTNGPNSVD